VSPENSLSLALKSDGSVVAWGTTSDEEIMVPLGLSGVLCLTAGWEYSLALKSDGTVVAWGYDDSGQSTVPRGLSGVIAIAAGEDHSLALKSDGTVAAWGWNSYGQSAVPSGLSGVIAIAAGGFHSLALVAPPNPTLAGLGLLTGVGFDLACYGLPGSNYTLQASTNLRDWAVVQDFVGTNGPVYLRDPAAINHSRRF